MIQLNLDGRLGKDSEVKTSQKGKQYIRFSLANTTYIKGEEKTTWYDVTSFDQNIINQSEHLTKGKYVFVSGLYDCDAVVKNGQIYINHSILASSVNYLSGGMKQASDSNSASGKDKSSADYEITTNYKPNQSNTASASKPTQVNPTVINDSPSHSLSSQSMEDDGDDLPF